MATLYNIQIWATPNQPSELIEAFRVFADEARGCGLKVRRIGRAIDQQLADLEAEKNAIIERHAKRDSAGKVLSRADGTVVMEPEGNEELATMLRQTFEVETINASEVRNIDDIPGGVLLALGDLFVDDSEG
jgi:hypothetical protein